MPDMRLPRTLLRNTSKDTASRTAKTSTPHPDWGSHGNGYAPSPSLKLESPTFPGYVTGSNRSYLASTSAASNSELAIDDGDDIDEEDDESDDGFFDDMSFTPDSSEDEDEQNHQHQAPPPVNGKPELRCWEHGCNGRVFATPSNLARHQREKSNRRPSYLCPMCGAYFSRSTARNQHVDNKSCGRIRRYSNGRQRVRGPRNARKM